MPVRDWEESFREGVAAFRTSNFEEALQCFNEAIQLDETRFKAYDSRAATYEKLGKLKDALRDSKKVIELAPDLHHGYARSARLFFDIGKYAAAKEMADCALERVPEDVPARCQDLRALRLMIDTTISSQDGQTELSKESSAESPFSKLAVELVCQVFDLVMEDDKIFPATACLVSSHWRAFTLSRPTYWSYLVLSHRHPVKKMSLWLTRSKNKITGLRTTYSISLPDLYEALKLCSSEVFKALKTVDLETGVDIFMRISAAMETPVVPGVLRVLDLHAVRLSRGEALAKIDFPNSQLFTSAPVVGDLFPIISKTALSNVNSLTVEYLAVNWEVVMPRLHLLQTLVIKTKSLPPVPILMALFVANVGLEKLVLSTQLVGGWHLEEEDEPDISNTILLPQLIHLELRGNMDLVRSMASLSVPALRHLYLCRTSPRADVIIETMHPIPTGLTEFTIRNCTFTSARVATFLQHLTQLEKVEITLHGGDMDTIVDVFSQTCRVGDGEERLKYPSLRHVDFSHSPKLNGGPIFRLVKSRMEAANSSTNEDQGRPQDCCPARLEEICIDHCPRIDPSVPEWLRQRVKRVSCVYMTKKEIKKLAGK